MPLRSLWRAGLGVAFLAWTNFARLAWAQPLPTSEQLAQARQAEFARRKLDDPALLTFLGRALPADGPWDLDRLTLAALFYSPELDVVRARIDAAEAAIVTARTVPNPRLSFSFGFPFVIAAALQLPADTAALRGWRTLRAQWLSQASRFEFYEAVWSLRSRLRTALLALDAAQAGQDLDASELDTRQALTLWADQRFRLGELSRFELETYRVGEARASSLQGQTLVRLREAQGTVAQLIGVPLAVFTSVSWNSGVFQEEPPPLPALELQRRGLTQRPDLHQALSEYTAALADVQLETEVAEPVLQTTPAAQFGQGGGGNEISLGFSLPLPFNDLNEGPIADRLARAREIRARFYGLQDRALGQIAAAIQGLTTARQAYDQAQNLTQRSRDQEVRVLRSLRAGEADRSALLAARLETTLSERSELEARLSFQRQLGLLEDALRTPLQGRLRENAP